MAYDPLVINFIKTTAVILRTYEYSETSYVLSLLTRDHGRLHALAKGARRPKGTFGGEIDLLAEGQAVLLMHPDTSLHLLTEFSCRNRRLALRSSLARSYAACYVADAVAAASPEGDAQPELYDLLTHTLDFLETDDVAAAVAFFQIHLLDLAGFMPDLKHCAGCGAALGRRAAAGPQLTYSFLKGGLLCEECVAGDGEKGRGGEGETRGRGDTGTRGRGDTGTRGRGRVGAGLPNPRGNGPPADGPPSGGPPIGGITGTECAVSRGAIAFINSLARTHSAALHRAKVPYPLAVETISFLGHVIAAAFENEPRTLKALLARMTKQQKASAGNTARRRGEYQPKRRPTEPPSR